MATAVLSVVGAVAGAPFGPVGMAVGQAIGATLGSVIDRYLLFPPEYPRQVVGLLENTRSSTSDEGTALPWFMGTARVTAPIIWQLADYASIIDRYGPDDSVEHYTYFTSIHAIISESYIEQVDLILLNNKPFYDVRWLDDPDWPHATPYPPVDLADVVLFDGQSAHTPWSVAEAQEGSGLVPAYDGMGSIGLERVRFHHIGAPLYSVQVVARTVADDTIASADAAEALLVQAGIPAGDIDLSAVTAVVCGVTRAGVQAPAQALDQLRRAGLFDLRESDEIITGVMRGGAAVATIPAADLGAVWEGATDAPPWRPVDTDARTLPATLTVTARDADRQGEPLSRTARGTSSRASLVDAVLSLDQLMLTAQQAQTIAEISLHAAWLERRTVRLQLAPRWAVLEAGDVVTVESPSGALYRVRCAEVLTGANLAVIVEGVIEVEGAYTASDVAYESGGVIVQPPDDLIGSARLVLLDLPPLTDADVPGLQMHAACTLAEAGAIWQGAALQRSSDGGTTWTGIVPMTREAQIGDVATALAVGVTAYPDRGGSIVVQADRWVPADIDDVALAAGGNLAWLGDPASGQGELLQWRDVQDLGGGSYRLTHLLRGLRGTEDMVATHGADEVLVVLDRATLARIGMSQAEIGVERTWRAVAPTEAEADAGEQDWTWRARCALPLSPYAAAISRDGGNNITIAITRRDRAIWDLAATTPMSEAAEAYEIDVMSGSTVLRTIAATSASASYSAAQQTADGLTPGDPVTVRIYQMSARVGRGGVLEVTG